MKKRYRNLSIIGLGYVGLELAHHFAQCKIKIVCYDKSAKRVEELKRQFDINKDLNAQQLASSYLHFTNDPEDLSIADFHIITVSTPITPDNIPDLSHLKEASKIVGQHFKKGDIVVYESTVYPGATEDECIPILQQYSQLINNKDFFVGYSPERVNVADATHTIKNTVKIVAAQNSQTLNIIKSVYETIVDAGIYCAPNIKTAEAAKLIENTQRDLNISLMNELSMILHKLGINARDVREAAATKWNFIPVEPGLVGGHCISVDPYYFTYLAHKLQFNEKLIKIAREINNDMSSFIVETLIKRLIKLNIRIKKARIAIMGFTFKENCSDIRNTKVFQLLEALEKYEMQVCVHDPVANKQSVKEVYGVSLVDYSQIHSMHAVIFAVKHHQFMQLEPASISAMLTEPGVLMDLKNMWNESDFSNYSIDYWSL